MSPRFLQNYAIGLTVVSFAFISAGAFGPALFPMPMAPESWRLVDTVVGFLLGTGLSAIIQYAYGSSAGSRAKDAALAASGAPSADPAT
jgi:hypothetical protein